MGVRSVAAVRSGRVDAVIVLSAELVPVDKAVDKLLM